MYPQPPIQQQYFTRDREGVFRTNEGFDTVAKSPGLKPEFIKNALHPYCFYKAPQELLTRGEADEARYPAAFGAYYAADGSLVIGRTVYVAADFTGQRSAFFTHQYVIPKERAEDWVREPNRIFRIQGFRSSYDIREGKEIPELEDMDYDAEAVPEGVDADLALLNFDRVKFQQLLHAVMLTLTNKRKVYVSLDGEPAESAESARRLMELVYGGLPYAVRRRLGFLTYSSEPEAKQDIHVVFVEKGALRPGDRQLEKESLFDLPNGRFVNADLPGGEQPYYEYVWHHRSEPERLMPLLDFCDEALQGLDPALAYVPSAYNELCTLFEIEQGRDSLYAADRAGTVRSLLRYIGGGPQALAAKPRLHALLLRLLRKEAADSASPPTAEYMAALLPYEALAGEDTRGQLYKCAAFMLERAAAKPAAAAGAAEDLAALRPLWAPLESSAALLRGVLRELHARRPALAEAYAAERLTRASGPAAFVQELGRVLEAAEALPLTFFAEAALKKVKGLLRGSAAKQTETAGALAAELDGLARREGTRPTAELAELILLDLQLGLLETLEPEKLGYDEFRRLGFMLEKPRAELQPHLSTGTKLTLAWLSAVYSVLALEPGTESGPAKSAEAALAKLGPYELEQAQGVLKRALEERVAPPHFHQLAYAFLRPEGLSGGSAAEQGAGYDYSALLGYIAGHTRGADTIYDFIVWSAGQEPYRTAKGGIAPHYRAALMRYFDTQDPAAFRRKEVKLRLLAVPNPAFAALFREIRLKQAPGWMKLLERRKRQLLLVGVPLLVLILVLIIGGKGLMGSILRPVPSLTVEALPEKTNTAGITVKATASDSYDAEPSIYVNGVLAGQGHIVKELSLSVGSNVVEVKAKNKYGKLSEPFTRTVVVEPLPPLPSPPQTLTPSANSGTPAGPGTEGSSGGAVQGPPAPGSGTATSPSGGKAAGTGTTKK